MGVGGLLPVPLLLAIAFEALAALAMSKVQRSVATCSSTWVFLRAGQINPAPHHIGGCICRPGARAAAGGFGMALIAGPTRLTWLIARARRPIDALGYSLIMGGALGNAFDRAMRGQVIDYLDFFAAGRRWPVFNLADAAIIAGAAAVIGASLGEARGDRKAEVSHHGMTNGSRRDKSP